MIITGIIAATGGSGASTISAYSARLLGLTNQKVLVVDLNPFNETARLLSPSKKTDIAAEINTKNIVFERCISPSKFKNIDIITSFGEKIKTYNQIESSLLENDFFKQLKHFAQDKYVHVIIDYSAHFSPVIQSAIGICNKVIGVINAQPQSITKSIPFLEMVAQARIDKPLKFIKLLLNNVDSSNPGSRLVVKQYQANLDKQLKFPIVINQFKYVKKQGKVTLQLPIKAFNVVAKIIQEGKAEVTQGKEK